MNPLRLTAVPRKIINYLQQSYPMSYRSVARALKLPTWTAHRYWIYLIRSGIIRGGVVEIDVALLGMPSCYALVTLDDQKLETLLAFDAYIRIWPGICECYMVNGKSYDFILKIEAFSFEQERELIYRLTKTSMVHNVLTLPISKTCFRHYGVPL